MEVWIGIWQMQNTNKRGEFPALLLAAPLSLETPRVPMTPSCLWTGDVELCTPSTKHRERKEYYPTKPKKNPQKKMQ